MCLLWITLSALIPVNFDFDTQSRTKCVLYKCSGITVHMNVARPHLSNLIGSEFLEWLK